MPQCLPCRSAASYKLRLSDFACMGCVWQALQQRCREAEASLAEVEEQRRSSEAHLQALGHKVTQAQQAHDEVKRQAAESKQSAEAERTRLDEVRPHGASLRALLVHPTDDDTRTPSDSHPHHEFSTGPSSRLTICLAVQVRGRVQSSVEEAAGMRESLTSLRRDAADAKAALDHTRSAHTSTTVHWGLGPCAPWS